MLLIVLLFFTFFFFKQKTAYEMRISDWSSDVCSSDLRSAGPHQLVRRLAVDAPEVRPPHDVKPGDVGSVVLDERVGARLGVGDDPSHRVARQGDRKSVV